MTTNDEDLRVFLQEVEVQTKLPDEGILGHGFRLRHPVRRLADTGPERRRLPHTREPRDLAESQLSRLPSRRGPRHRPHTALKGLTRRSAWDKPDIPADEHPGHGGL
jgi:hypothetical protein